MDEFQNPDYRPMNRPNFNGLIPPKYNPLMDSSYQYKVAPTTTGLTQIAFRAYEQFRPYPNNEKYLVSNIGRVYNTVRNKQQVYSLDKDGYAKYYLGKSVRAHRAVMETFAPPNPDPERLTEINHGDGYKLNNYYLGPNNTNLEYCSTEDNIHHALETGLRQQTGEQNQFAKIDNQMAEEICKRIAMGMTGRQIAEDIGVQYTPQFQDRITKIRTGKTWTSISEKYDIKPVFKRGEHGEIIRDQYTCPKTPRKYTGDSYFDELCIVDIPTGQENQNK